MHLLLANPTSGGGKGERIKAKVTRNLLEKEIQFLDISGSSYESATVSLENALELHPAAESLILVGGDGLVHLAIQKLAGTGIPMLIVPAGTGNDLARALGLDLSQPENSLELLQTKSPTSIDLGISNGEYFADILSTGFDSVVNERANRMRWIRGRLKYNLAILLELPIFRPRRYRFQIDGEVFDIDAMLIAIANGQSYGGGMNVCPDAEIDDGVFDVMILEPVSKFEFLRVFPKVFKGEHITHPKVRMLRGKRIKVEAKAIAYSDGERMGPLPILAEIVPNALRIWRQR